MMNRLVTFVLVLAAICGCKTQEEALVGKPPTGSDAVVAGPRQLPDGAAKPARPQYPAPALTVGTWPFNEDRTTFRLSWKGSATGLPLHEEPDPNSEILGEVSWKKGERIQWQNTAVSVYQPSTVRLREEWFAEGPVHTTGYRTDDDYVSESVRAGQTVDVYLYASAGQCFMGLGGKVFVGSCPPRDKLQGTFTSERRADWYQPAKMVWWIQVTDDLTTGWFPMDDRVKVDIEAE